MGNLVPNYAVCFIFVILHTGGELQANKTETGHPFCFCTKQLCLMEIQLHNRRSPGRWAVAGGGERVTPELYIFLVLEFKSHSLSFLISMG